MISVNTGLVRAVVWHGRSVTTSIQATAWSAETLQGPKLFLAHLMTHGTLEDIAIAMKYYSDADFDLVLKDPPAGIFDLRSWNYWNLRYHHEPVPPLPQRIFPGTDVVGA
jgi:hypothetical protein